MPHSCIIKQFVEVKAGFSICLIEKNVKVNIMLFRTLCSIEFQGSCSKNVNVRQFENCNFGIYRQQAFS